MAAAPIYSPLGIIHHASAESAETKSRFDTKVPMLDPGRARVKQGYFWAVACDDRPWGRTDPPAIASTYAPGAAHALKLLDGYRPLRRLKREEGARSTRPGGHQCKARPMGMGRCLEANVNARETEASKRVKYICSTKPHGSGINAAAILR
jgi:hypothetical protein